MPVKLDEIQKLIIMCFCTLERLENKQIWQGQHDVEKGVLVVGKAMCKDSLIKQWFATVYSFPPIDICFCSGPGLMLGYSETYIHLNIQGQFFFPVFLTSFKNV